MPLADQLTMGPIQKYKYYNVFPWDFIIHVLIVFMTTLQILAMIETTGGYSRNQANLFYYRFLANEKDNDDVVSSINSISIKLFYRNPTIMKILGMRCICSTERRSKSTSTAQLAPTLT